MQGCYTDKAGIGKPQTLPTNEPGKSRRRPYRRRLGGGTGSRTYVKAALHTLLTQAEVFQQLDPRARSVFMFLWGTADAPEEDQDGRTVLYCWPKIQTIAKAENCKRRTVERALSRLESAGLIARATTGRYNVYALFPPADDETDAPEATETPQQIGQPCRSRCDIGDASIEQDQDQDQEQTTPATAEPTATAGGDVGVGSDGVVVVDDRPVGVVVDRPDGGVVPERPTVVGSSAELIRQLRQIGVSGHVAVELVGKYSADQIMAAIEAAKKARNPAGFLVRALREQWDLEPPEAESPPPIGERLVEQTTGYIQSQREYKAQVERERQAAIARGEEWPPRWVPDGKPI